MARTSASLQTISEGEFGRGPEEVDAPVALMLLPAVRDGVVSDVGILEEKLSSVVGGARNECVLSMRERSSTPSRESTKSPVTGANGKMRPSPETGEPGAKQGE